MSTGISTVIIAVIVAVAVGIVAISLQTLQPEVSQGPIEGKSEQLPKEKTQTQPGEEEISPKLEVIGDGNNLVTFEGKVPDWTPKEDRIYIRIDNFDDLLMKEKEPNIWTLSLKAPEDREIKYKYNRNKFGFPTDEQFYPDNENARRTITVKAEPMAIADEVSGWRWLNPQKPQAQLSIFKPDSLPKRDGPFVVGIFMLDFYNPIFVDYIPSTFDKLKEKGFKYVGLPYFSLKIISEQPLVTAQANNWSDREFELIVNEAKKRGLKLMLWAGIETAPDALVADAYDDDWYVDYATKWKDEMVGAAKKAEQYDVEIFIPSNTWSFQFKSETQKQFVASLVKDAYKEIRKVFLGKITSDFYTESGIDFYGELDWVGDKWWWSLTDKKDATLQEMIERAERVIDETYEKIYAKYKKPIFLQQVAYGSYDGAAGAMQLSTEGPELAEGQPYNDNYPFDFQEQADAYEAAFQAIHDEPIFIGVAAFSYTYWNDHDKSVGFRDKPAEDVWVRWNDIFQTLSN